MKINIPIAKVDLNKNEINSVLGPLKNGWLVQGPKVKEFEKNGQISQIKIFYCSYLMHICSTIISSCLRL